MIASLPYLGAILALISYASLPVLAKFIGHDIPPFIFIAVVSFLVALMALGLSLTQGEKISILSSSQHYLHLLMFSVINIIAFWAFLYSTKSLPITQYQLFIILSPIIGAVLAKLMLGEPFEIKYMIAFPIILSGLVISLLKL